MHNLITTPWALTPGTYDALRDWYLARLEAGQAGEAAMAAALPAVQAVVSGRSPDMAQGQDYVLTPGGTALITMAGVLMPKTTGMAGLCNPAAASSAAVLRQQIEAAQADPKARAALLYIDSPGGNILGVAEAAQALAALAAVKPVVVFSDGLMASAAYWIGSAAPKLYISGPMVQVGSIGVRMEQIDTAGADAKAGISRKTITFGKYKARGGTAGGGDVAAYDQHQQDQVDYLGSLFVDAVAKSRGLDPQVVADELATGQVFVGQQAIDAGLVDGITTLADLLAALESNPASVTTVPGAAQGQPTKSTGTPVKQQPAKPSKGTHAMTPEEIQAQFPEAYNAIHTAGFSAGSTAERDRIQAVRAQALPGHEALIEKMAFDGKSTGADAAMAVLSAERALVASRAAAHFSAGIAPVARSAGSPEQDAQDAGKKPGRVTKIIDAKAAFAGL